MPTIWSHLMPREVIGKCKSLQDFAASARYVFILLDRGRADELFKYL